jgi:hypothetical protein
MSSPSPSLWSPLYCVATYGVPDSAFERSGRGEGSTLLHRRLDGGVTSIVPACPDHVFRREDGFSVHLGQLAPFVFPSGIHLYDAARPVLQQQGEPAHRELAVSIAGKQYAVAIDYRELPASQTHSCVHSFMCTSQTEDAEPYYGMVLTRWHAIRDQRRIALLRLQLAARHVLSKGAKNADASEEEIFAPTRSCHDPTRARARDLRALLRVAQKLAALARRAPGAPPEAG